MDQVSASCPAILSHHLHALAQTWTASMPAFQFAGKNKVLDRQLACQTEASGGCPLSFLTSH